MVPKETEGRIGIVERFTLGKGVSQEQNDGCWTKEYFEVEVRLPEKATEKDCVANFMAAEYLIDQLLEKPKSTAQHSAAPQVKLTMTREELDALPWLASKWVRPSDADRMARANEDAYMIEDLENPQEKLNAMVDEAKKMGLKVVDFPPYKLEYKLKQGYNTGMYVRYGPRQESAKK